MAAAVVAVVVDDLLWKLLRGMELGPQWGVEAQLREIHDLLSSVQGVLPEAERKFPYSFELQDMIKKLKDVVYDAEDLLEDLSLEEPLRLLDGKLRSLFRQVESCWFGWRMRWELQAIAGRLRGLTDPLNSIIRSIPAEVQEVLEAREIPFVGRVNEKGKLIWFLMDGGSAAVTVDGSWGVGKTALVQEVMKDSGVSGYFDVKIWVNVSAAPFDTNRVAQEIIGSLREEEDEEEGEVFGWEQSIYLLARLLDDTKRYLFVLDNMSRRHWNSEGWLRFRSLLEGGVASGSKILVTVSDIWVPEKPDLGSRIRGVFIRMMDRKDALVLLSETASQGREGYHYLLNNPAILKIVGDIVDKCDLWNLRKIKAAGGYLSLQPPPLSAVADWTPLLNMLRDSRDHGYSLLLRGGYPYADLTSRIGKSYINLAPRIKRCFSLCSLFPRGHLINPHTLAELWISLGFIINDYDGDDRRSLEDIASHYLDVLLREELFRVKKYDNFGKVKSVTLHPHAQELAPNIAGWECKPYPVDLRVDYLKLRHARHRSIIDYETPIWHDDFPHDKLRTFLHFEEDRNKLEEIYRRLIPKLSPKRNCVRVLDLHDVKADVLQEGVWKLKHLRYLDLSGNSMLQMLPPAIIRLMNLQTLKLSGCSSLTELPREMNNLSALRHLYIDGCRKLSLIPRGLCDLKCLNILTDFILPPDDSSKKADSAGLTDLCKLNDLKGSLEIRNLGCYDEKLTDEGSEGLLDKKSYLESVELQFMNLPTDASLLEKLQPHRNLKGLRIHNYGGTQYPKWMTLLRDLVEIALIGCENCMYLPLIDHLPHLKKLTIQGLSDLEHLESRSGRSLTEDANDVQPFSNLSSLCIKDCPKLNSLPMIPRLMKLTLVNVSEAIFWHPCQLPNLKTLRLENIELLDHLTEEWLRGLTSLKELHIRSCHSLVSFLPGISLLRKLETLSIWNCKELDLSKNEQGNVAIKLQSLKSLTIYKASKLEHLPEWLSQVATLKFLCVRSCPSLVVLPEWIENLKLLELIHCPQLKTLPAGMLESSDDYRWKMNIKGCPLLKTGRIKPSCKL